MGKQTLHRWDNYGTISTAAMEGVLGTWSDSFRPSLGDPAAAWPGHPPALGDDNTGLADQGAGQFPRLPPGTSVLPGFQASLQLSPAKALKEPGHTPDVSAFHRVICKPPVTHRGWMIGVGFQAVESGSRLQNRARSGVRGRSPTNTPVTREGGQAC